MTGWTLSARIEGVGVGDTSGAELLAEAPQPSTSKASEQLATAYRGIVRSRFIMSLCFVVRSVVGRNRLLARVPFVPGFSIIASRPRERYGTGGLKLVSFVGTVGRDRQPSQTAKLLMLLPDLFHDLVD